jgi:hypothetical protein
MKAAYAQRTPRNARKPNTIAATALIIRSLAPRHPPLCVDESNQGRDVLLSQRRVRHLLAVRWRLDCRVRQEFREVRGREPAIGEIRPEITELTFDADVAVSVTCDATRCREHAAAALSLPERLNADCLEMVFDCSANLGDRIDDSPRKQDSLAAPESTLDSDLPVTA